MITPNRLKNWITRFLQVFFEHLYHRLAWSYDAVAFSVSLGMWQDWVKSVLPHLQGPRILELGHGPGHLQVRLAQNEFQIFGLDESKQMGQLARQKLKKHGQAVRLSNGYAQSIPFPNDYFDEVVATFPSEYIASPKTVAEIWRVLKPQGQLVILPVAWITAKGIFHRLAAGLFRITDQAPKWDERFVIPFQKAGFQAQTQQISQKSWTAMLILATKSTPHPCP